ncbi:MAG: hypothetical protein H0U70_09895 [Tatlockia sp.]|nr:hypothetical protein [Tatlockia sp.]
MGYGKHFEIFAADKRDFFASGIKTINEVEKKASFNDYGYIATNEKLIREEFNLLFKRLREDEVKQDIIWFYCYYCCLMLQNYHLAYDQKKKSEEFANLAKQIQTRCDSGSFPQEKSKQDSFLTFLAHKISEALEDLVLTPTQISKIRDKVAFANLIRLYWVFCRNVITQAFTIGSDWGWIDKINSSLDVNIDVDNIISTLEKPNSTLRVLSVAFFSVRFIINSAMLIKHVWFPSEEEKKLNWKKRFANEIYKRHGDLLNDLVWGPVNLVTNYNHLFGIANPAVGYILVGFLFFDLCLIIWRRFLAKQEYLTKHLQLTKDRQFYETSSRVIPDYNQSKAELSKQLEQMNLDAEQCRILTQQINDLELNWQAKDETFWFSATAAILLMVGFSGAMVFSAPVLIFASYAICTFAVAMYLSTEEYNNYKTKQLISDQSITKDLNVVQAANDYSTAQNEFIWALFKNAVVPTLAITLYAVCWQAALVLTAAFFCYQLFNLYCEYSRASEESTQQGTLASKDENDVELELLQFAC